MLFIDLPADILQLICNFLDGKSIFDLILSGNKLINEHLLSKNCVQKFDQLLDEFVLPQLLWPSIISKFTSLRELQLKLSKDYSHLHISGNLFENLPKTLTKIVFDFGNASLLFFVGQTNHFDTENILYELSSNFSVLEHLYIRESCCDRINMQENEESCSAHLTSFPKSLRYLHLDLSSKSHKISINMHELPSDLEYCCIRGCNLVDLDFDLFPSFVQSLDLHLNKTDTNLILEKDIHFGPHLCDINISCKASQLEKVKNILWPRVLKNLSFSFHGPSHNYFDHILYNLPSSLESFEMKVVRYNSRPSVNLIELLPKNLTRLSLFLCSHVPASCFINLPETLIEFYCSNITGLDDNSFINLPRKIKTLSLILAFSGSTRGTGFRNLPPKLTSFKLFPVSKLAKDAWYMLPRSITQLELYASPSSTQFRDLPRNLTYFDGSAIKCTIPSLKDLPRSFRELHVELKSTKEEKIGVQQFHLSEPSIDDMDDSIKNEWVDDIIPIWPPNLTNLSVMKSAALKSTWLFCTLPKFLTQLCVASTHDFSGIHIKQLPKTLLKLQVMHCGVILDKHVKDLPRRLIEFSWVPYTLTTACIPDLPKLIIPQLEEILQKRN